jgi:hypothetical protein
MKEMILKTKSSVGISQKYPLVVGSEIGMPRGQGEVLSKKNNHSMNVKMNAYSNPQILKENSLVHNNIE